MDVSAEAKRVMVQALSKMYSSRAQRGGLRLHRSLLLTLVMKSARDIYHSARAACEGQEPQELQEPGENRGEAAEPHSEPPPQEDPTMEVSSPEVPRAPQPEPDQENRSPARADRHARKRRGKTATEPDFLPCKRAKMDSGEVLRILQDTSFRRNAGKCGRDTDSLTHTASLIPRTVATC